jgi:RND family efflux transporter MFP subunit
MLWLAPAALLLAACQQEIEQAAPVARPVRTVTVEKGAPGRPISLTGRIEAEDDVVLGFRIAGRVTQNDLKLGDQLKPGQIVARLEPQNELNTLRSAQANLAAAEGRLVQARNNFERQEFLLKRDVASRATFDEAEERLQTAQSRVDALEAQVTAAQDLVSFTELKADAPGTVIAVGPAAGEVVQAGQMIVRLARQGGRDAVVNVPADLIRSGSPDPRIVVSLSDDPAVTAQGRVREVAPQADPATRTFEVRVGLTDPPPAMRLGATVVARVEPPPSPLAQIPAAALTQNNGQPAVWIVDPASLKVSMRDVELVNKDSFLVDVSKGLEVGEIVVTAGVRSLHPGQKVRLLGTQQ